MGGGLVLIQKTLNHKLLKHPLGGFLRTHFLARGTYLLMRCSLNYPLSFDAPLNH